MSDKQDDHEETYHFKYETPEAILVSDQAGENGNEWWLPKSKITYERNGRMVDVVVPHWLALAKEMI